MSDTTPKRKRPSDELADALRREAEQQIVTVDGIDYVDIGLATWTDEDGSRRYGRQYATLDSLAIEAAMRGMK